MLCELHCGQGTANCSWRPGLLALAGCKLDDAGGARSATFANLSLAVVISTVVRRRNAVRAQFFFGFRRDPVGSPCRGELSFNFAFQAMGLQQVVYVVFNLTHGGTAAVGGRDDHFQLFSAILRKSCSHIAQDTLARAR